MGARVQQTINNIDNGNAHVDALGPEQGPEAMFARQRVSACMPLPVE